MPYIEPERRKPIDEAFEDLRITDDGELNYAMSKLAIRYLATSTAGAPRYSDYAAVIAAFECAKAEFIRMHLVPYEVKKIALHGPVRP